jgi:hypothetical protein
VHGKKKESLKSREYLTGAVPKVSSASFLFLSWPFNIRFRFKHRPLVITSVNRFSCILNIKMKFSSSLVLALVACVAANEIPPTSSSNTSPTAKNSSSTKMSSMTKIPLITVVLPPITDTVSTYITCCPSPTVFAVGNNSYTATTATYITVACPTNVPFPIMQQPTAVPVAPFGNNTAPFQNNHAPATCPSGVTCPMSNSASVNGQGQSANAQVQSTSNVGASTNGSASAGTDMGSMSNAGASRGANGGASTQNNAAGGNSASGSASGPVLTNDANKAGASILTLIVVVAAAIGL